MKQGDKFNTRGYCYVASIDGYTDGEAYRVVVLHNHSTHYLVAEVGTPLEVAMDSGVISDASEPTSGEDATLIASYYYGGGTQEEIVEYYRQVLKLAVSNATDRIH